MPLSDEGCPIIEAKRPIPDLKKCAILLVFSRHYMYGGVRSGEVGR